ncbi:MAG: hypothetical protein JJE04_02835 [Acidobacteriia bacterium]|nr:hypothetical protein [Terriglobia bacterium]
MLFPFLLAAITFHIDFEGASLGKVEQTSPGHFICPVRGEADQDGRNRQANWYYFRVDGAARGALTIDLTNLVGEYNYTPGSHAVTSNTRPVFSYDNKTWMHFSSNQVEWDKQRIRLRLRFTPDRNRVWIAHVPPYTNQHLDALLKDARPSAHYQYENTGNTVDGRPMPLVTITNPRVPAVGKKVAWLMFRQHSWETGSSWAGDGAIRFLLSEQGAALREQVIWKIFPMADPDGVSRGGVRFNKNGYDLNRNWDPNRGMFQPGLMPEIAAQKKAILAWLDAGHRIDFFLTLHNTESGEYLEGSHAPLGERLEKLLLETTSFHPSRPFRRAEASTTPGKPGRMNVAQGLHAERDIPAFGMEQRVEFNTKLGRLPTVADREEFGRQLVQAIAAALR